MSLASLALTVPRERGRPDAPTGVILRVDDAAVVREKWQVPKHGLGWGGGRRPVSGVGVTLVPTRLAPVLGGDRDAIDLAEGETQRTERVLRISPPPGHPAEP